MAMSVPTQEKRSKPVERQVRNGLPNQKTNPQKGDHNGRHTSREDGVSTDELIGHLTHGTCSSILRSSTYDKEYPSLNGRSHSTESSGNHNHTAGFSKVSPSSSTPSSSSVSEAPPKTLFAGSLSEDLSRHLTGGQAPLCNGYGISLVKPDPPRPQSQPFTILTVPGGKRYQPPTMRPTPKPDASLFSPGSPNAPLGSPLGILAHPRSDTGGNSLQPGSIVTLSFGSSSGVPETANPASKQASAMLGGTPVERPSALSFSKGQSNVAKPTTTSPITMISSFLSSESGDTSNGPTSAGAAGSTIPPHGTTVSALLKLKLADNNAPKIVNKPGQEAKPPPIPSSSATSYTVPAGPLSYPLHSRDYPPLPGQGQGQGQGPSPSPPTVSVAPPPLLHHVPQLHPNHFMGMPPHGPMPHQFQHMSMQAPPPPPRSYYPSAPPDRPKPPSSMNPNAPPFRPSGRDSGLPQPHSGCEGGWDDEAMWGKEAEFAAAAAPPATHNWSGFNPNAPPFVSKNFLAKSTSDPGQDGRSQRHYKVDQDQLRKSKSLLAEGDEAQFPRRKARQPCLVCGQESTLECSTCAQIRRRLGIPLRTFFCSTEHQTQAWKQHQEEVHLQHPLSGVPSLQKQRQQAIVRRASDTPGEKATESVSGSSSDGNGELDGAPDSEAMGGADSWNGSVSPAEDGGDGDLALRPNGHRLTPPPAGPSDGDAGGGKCSPSLVYVPEEDHGDGDGHPLAESELESIGNSILNDFDDMIMAAPSAVMGAEAKHPGPGDAGGRDVDPPGARNGRPT
eukprot:TRINITY_DN14108_c0_g1_i1.p1 TRINITY_DN14108_c0_g1~~TRINITY_DN14108_c0_g1_i1.p1  ORF type:complete len:786 (+),score=89.14 TRINITY_DN14108_c0_g1_i1:46-2403(+)